MEVDNSLKDIENDSNQEINVQPDKKENEQEVPTIREVSSIEQVEKIELKNPEESNLINEKKKDNSVFDEKAYFKDLKTDFLREFSSIVEKIKVRGISKKYGDLFVFIYQGINTALKR